MDAGIGRVAELIGEIALRIQRLDLRQEDVARIGHQEARIGDGDHLRPVTAQERDLFPADAVAGIEPGAVAPRRADGGQPDAGITAGQVEDQPAGTQPARPFAVADERQSGAVLDAAAGVQRLDLCHDPGVQPLGPAEVAQFEKRRRTDQFGDVLPDHAASS